MSKCVRFINCFIMRFPFTQLISYLFVCRHSLQDNLLINNYSTIKSPVRLMLISSSEQIHFWRRWTHRLLLIFLIWTVAHSALCRSLLFVDRQHKSPQRSKVTRPDGRLYRKNLAFFDPTECGKRSRAVDWRLFPPGSNEGKSSLFRLQTDSASWWWPC